MLIIQHETYKTLSAVYKSSPLLLETASIIWYDDNHNKNTLSNYSERQKKPDFHYYQSDMEQKEKRKMKIVKKISLWLVSMLTTAALVEAVGLGFVHLIGGPDLIKSLSAWSNKSEKLLTPVLVEKTEENNYSNGLENLYVRGIVDNVSYSLSEENEKAVLFFCDMDVDQSVIFFNKDGMTDLSTGSFLSVYQLPENETSKLKNTIGLIDLGKLMENDDAAELSKMILNTDEEPVIQINSYSISDNYIITPAEITVSGQNGNVLGKFEFSTGGNIIKSDNAFVNYGSKTYLDGDFKAVSSGERKVDKIAKQTAENMDFSSGDQYTGKKIIGIGSYTMIHSENTGEWGEVAVVKYSFLRSFILFFSVIGGILTVILLVFFHLNDKKALQSDSSYDNV